MSDNLNRKQNYYRANRGYFAYHAQLNRLRKRGQSIVDVMPKRLEDCYYPQRWNE